MYIHVNVDGVVIDHTDEALFVAKNGDVKYLTYDRDIAIAAYGSDSTIRQLAKVSLITDFNTVLDLIPVQDVPEDYEPGKYVYNYTDGSFSLYKGVAPLTNTDLTIENNENKEDIADTRTGLIETYDETLSNTSDIADCRTAIIELYEMIANGGN